MDVHVRRAVTEGLRQRGVDVVTAQEDGSATLDDPQLLDRAGRLGRVLFSQDEDLLSEAARRQRQGIPFVGLVYAHPLRITDGRAILDLELMASVYEPPDIENRVEYLPL
jgi:predicted nuclease of predicted toxin-antitoxin system